MVQQIKVIARIKISIFFPRGETPVFRGNTTAAEVPVAGMHTRAIGLTSDFGLKHRRKKFLSYLIGRFNRLFIAFLGQVSDGDQYILIRFIRFLIDC